MLITAGIIETGLELFNFFLPIYARSLGLSASRIGIVMGSFAVALLAGSATATNAHATARRMARVTVELKR